MKIIIFFLRNSYSQLFVGEFCFHGFRKIQVNFLLIPCNTDKELLLSPFPYTMQDNNHLYSAHILLCASSDLEMIKRVQDENSSPASLCRMDTGTHWGEVKTLTTWRIKEAPYGKPEETPLK